VAPDHRTQPGQARPEYKQTHNINHLNHHTPWAARSVDHPGPPHGADAVVQSKVNGSSRFPHGQVRSLDLYKHTQLAGPYVFDG